MDRHTGTPRPCNVRDLAFDRGYLPIADHGLLGDGETAALIGRDGSVGWLCLPRFDADPLLCPLLDHAKGGTFTLAPREPVASCQRYVHDTGVLITEIECATGRLQVTDALTLTTRTCLEGDTAPARRELLRSAVVLEGTVDAQVTLEPRGGADVVRRDGALALQCHRPALAPLDVRLCASRPLDGLRSTVRLDRGERLDLALRWGERGPTPSSVYADDALEVTASAWRRWTSRITYGGPFEEQVRRSAIVLKQLDHASSGAVVAAPTSSLPEAIGGTRNWDYRYAWVRDAAFSVYAMNRIGLRGEAHDFLHWVLDAIERGAGAHVLFDLDGNEPPAERIDGDLEGYRQSAPVRWGNAAYHQTQHDAYGEILDCAYQWARQGEHVGPALWQRLVPLVQGAARRWCTPDQGIWEVRTAARPFTYSAALCQVALDRAARLTADPGGAAADSWARQARRIAAAIVHDAWDERRQTLTEHLDGTGGVDASLLALPLRRVVGANHPRMVATAAAVVSELGAGAGLLYRYRADVSPDGVSVHDEGAFVLASFWLADNLAYQGRLDEAYELVRSLAERGGALGLLPEQVDPSSGAFLGNYPQAFSHVGLISSAVNLERSAAGR